MKLKISTVLLLALLASCGREGLKEDITLPELPPQESDVIVSYPKNTQTFTIGKEHEDILYIAWKGLSLLNPVRMDLYKKNAFITMLQIRTGVDSTLCRLPDTLLSSVNYRVKVYEEANPNRFGFSEQFEVNGIPSNDSDSSDIPY